MQFDVVNSESKKIGEMDLKEEIFNTKLKPYLWHEIVKWQLAKKRQGTAKTKERNEVSGTTKKMYRQKGTGRARHGSAKSPIFVGGGQTFGPIPRSYDYNIPKKMKKVALSSALSMKQKRKLLKIVDALPMKGIKTIICSLRLPMWKQSRRTLK
jgi:large subunit ribosomal protein L4